MGFMDKFQDIAGRVGDTIGKGAKNVSETVKTKNDQMKIRREINKAESDLNVYYANIGKKFCELNSSDSPEEYADLMQNVHDAITKIDTLKNELAAIDTKGTVCPNCGEIIEKDSKFCAKCGKSINDVKADVQEVTEVHEDEIKDETSSEDEKPAESDNETEAQGDKTDAEEAVETVEAVPGKVCPSCGVPVKDDQKFCEKCGVKLEV